MVVIRRLDTGIALGSLSYLTDQAIATRWSQRLTTAVAERVADGGQDVVRFDNQAAFITSFVRDLLAGVAWDRWYYGAFSSLRDRSRDELLRKVLLENRVELPLVLGQLAADRTLDKVLRMLDGAAVQEVWAAVATDASVDRASLRPLVVQALVLMDELGLVTQACGTDRLLDDFMRTGPAPVDWRSSRSLAAAVRAIVLVGTNAGLFHRPSNSSLMALPDRLDSVLTNLDWLDNVWLKSALLELWTVPSRAIGRTAARSLAHKGGTPRQLALLDDLASVLLNGSFTFDSGDPAGRTNAVRWYAALLDRFPVWAGEPMAPALIDRFLVAWAVSTGRHLDGDSIALVQANAPLGMPSPGSALIDHLGTPAMKLLELLTGHSSTSGARAITGFDTRCVGIFFLLRAIRDLRLPSIFSAAFPALPQSETDDALRPVLLGIGLGLSGLQGTSDMLDDPGLRLFANLSNEESLLAILSRWGALNAIDHAHFQFQVFAALAGQHVVADPTLRIDYLRLDRGAAIVAGIEGSPLWCFAAVARGMDVDSALVSQWIDTVERTISVRPRLSFGTFVPQELSAEFLSSGDLPSSHPNERGGTATTVDLEELIPAGIDAFDAELTLATTGLAVLRSWARWLPRFGESTTRYLLQTFVRKSGRVSVSPDVIVVEAEPGPLDVILDLAGYRDDIETIPWLGGRKVRFER